MSARFEARRQFGQWRVFDTQTGKIAMNDAKATPIDGNGHGNDETKARNQARHLNDWYDRSQPKTQGQDA